MPWPSMWTRSWPSHHDKNPTLGQPSSSLVETLNTYSKPGWVAGGACLTYENISLGYCLKEGLRVGKGLLRAHDYLSWICLYFSFSSPLPTSTNSWWPSLCLTVPATTLRLDDSSLKPRCRPCLTLATGSTLTAHRTSWLPSEAFCPKSCWPEGACLKPWTSRPCGLLHVSAQDSGRH